MNNIKHVTSIKHRAQKCPRVSCRQGPIHLTNGGVADRSSKDDSRPQDVWKYAV